jgi:PAS domain S-box-containing protein
MLVLFDHAGGDNNASLFDDANALCTISGEIASMGVIIDVNLALVRLFGHSRQDMLGNNVSMLMPTPYSTFHQFSLLRYLETGETAVINRSRVLFGLHRSGWLVPIELFVREMSTATGLNFLGLMRAPQMSSLGTVVPLHHVCDGLQSHSKNY